ncbi:MAG TPA: hypothetical protein VF230_11035 [Acidimicrobiales bacterium]
MERLVVAAILVVLAVAVAVVLERRRPAAPTQPRRWDVPSQLDRADFPGEARPWLVAVFTSATCASCAKVLPKVQVLASDDVEVTEVPYQDRKDLHDRYAVDVVPMTVVADADGVVRASFIGEPTATDLWAAVAEVREPGSSPEPHLGHGHEHGVDD